MRVGKGSGLWQGQEMGVWAIGKGWHCRVFNIHVMYDNHAWKIKNTSFTPKSNTRDPGPIGKGSNFLIRMAS